MMDENVPAAIRSHVMRERQPVTFPNGEIRSLPNHPATPLIKAVLEIFALRYLAQPGAIRVAFPGQSADVRGWVECQTVFGSDLQPDSPNIILVDLAAGQFRLVFVETVTNQHQSRGMTEARRQAITAQTGRLRLNPNNVFFVTAFSDRSAPAFRKLVSELAWGTFAWFTSEPEKLLALRQGKPNSLPYLSIERNDAPQGDQ